MGFRSDQITDEMTRPLVAILLGCAAYYGVTRALTCHPIYNPRYLQWLAMSPWRPPVALPLDPLHPVWQDGAQMAILAMLGVLLCHTHPALPVTVLLCAYLVGVALALFQAGQRTIVAMLVAVLPVNGYLWGRWWLVLAVVVAMCLLALYGVHRSWSTFPWGVHERLTKLRANGTSTQMSVNPAQALGWPFDRLNAYDPPRHFDRRIVLACAMLAGWYVFSFCHCLPCPELRDPAKIADTIAIMGCLAASARLLVYCLVRVPPMNLFSRVVTGNLFLPGYDRILVAPLAVGLTAVIGPSVLRPTGIYPPLMAGILTTVVLTLVFCLPPTMRTWQLTGQYRMVPVKPRLSQGR